MEQTPRASLDSCSSPASSSPAQSSPTNDQCGLLNWNDPLWDEVVNKHNNESSTRKLRKFGEVGDLKRAPASTPSSRPGSTRQRGREFGETTSMEPRIHRRTTYSSSRRSSQSYHRRGSVAPSSTGPYRASSPLYRANTAPVWTLEDAIALHQRSCAVFQNKPGTTSSPLQPESQASSHNTSASSSVRSSPSIYSRPVDPFSLSSQGFNSQSTTNQEENTDEASAPYIAPPVIIHWTSPATRACEYAEIDRWTTGIRGALRKIAPRWFFRKSMRRFYDEKDASDTASVRRYRLDLSSDEHDEDSHQNEKAVPQKDGDKKASSGISKMSCF